MIARDTAGKTSQNIWAVTSSPLEIELLSLVFVLAAIILPFYVQMVHSNLPVQISRTLMEQATAPVVVHNNISNMRGTLWAVTIIGIYLIHLSVGSSQLYYNSTPVYYILAPFGFGALAYYRLLQQSRELNMTTPMINGTALELILWPVAILVVVTLLARLRLMRYRRRFKDVQWDLVTATRFDATYYTVMARELRPLIYPPRRYRFCGEGVLIEGWLYLVAVPFRAIESVSHVERFSTLTRADCFATSARNLVQLHLSEQVEPIMISPKDHDGVIKYCESRTRELIHLVKSKSKAMPIDPMMTG